MNSCPKGTLFIAAVSGGADSIAMLAALAAVRNRGDVFQFRCVHVEHGIRPAVESQGDAAFVQSQCKRLNVPCRVYSVAPGKITAAAKKLNIGIEAAARLFRFKALHRESELLEAALLKPMFQKMARRKTAAGNIPHVPVRIVTAHTADDKLETVLMRILRGSGPSGLSAMPQSRGRILRPLLGLRRSDVIAYLHEKNIPWREDSTNEDSRFLRNRIRHCLIPRLDESFPQWKKNIDSFAETQKITADFIQSEAAARVQWQTAGDGSLYTDECHFFAQPAIVREEALFQGIDKLPAFHGSVLPTSVKRATIRRFCRGGFSAIDAGLLRLYRKNGFVFLSEAKKNTNEYGFSLLINTLGLYNINGIAVEVRAVSGESDSAAKGASSVEGELSKKAGVFFAELPLVIRPCFAEDRLDGKKPAETGKSGAVFTAADSMGPAAFISSGGLIQRGNRLPQAASCVVTVTGK